MLRCADGSFYAGITTDLKRRLAQHNGELAGGARYTSGRRPVEVVYQEGCESRSKASIREIEIKTFSREQKKALAEL